MRTILIDVLIERPIDLTSRYRTERWNYAFKVSLFSFKIRSIPFRVAQREIVGNEASAMLFSQLLNKETR